MQTFVDMNMLNLLKYKWNIYFIQGLNFREPNP